MAELATQSISQRRPWHAYVLAAQGWPSRFGCVVVQTDCKRRRSGTGKRGAARSGKKELERPGGAGSCRCLLLDVLKVGYQLGYMDHDKLKIKTRMSLHLGLRPMFVVRMMPTSWIWEVERAGGFVLVLKYQLYPPVLKDPRSGSGKRQACR